MKNLAGVSAALILLLIIGWAIFMPNRFTRASLQEKCILDQNNSWLDGRVDVVRIGSDGISSLPVGDEMYLVRWEKYPFSGEYYFHVPLEVSKKSVLKYLNNHRTAKRYNRMHVDNYWKSKYPYLKK